MGAQFGKPGLRIEFIGFDEHAAPDPRNPHTVARHPELFGQPYSLTAAVPEELGMF